jgi:hypothetical protein
VLAARAAGVFVSVEPENGTLASGATVATNSGASGSKAVQFAAGTPTPTPTPTGGITFNHCTNPTTVIQSNINDPQNGVTLSGYYVTGDSWNFAKYPSSSQTMNICNYNNWYAMVNVSDTAGNGEVKTYPNVHKDYSNVPVSSLTTLTSIFAHTMPASGDWDAAYDVWFNGLNTELMIWTQSSGRQAHVPGIPKVGTVTLSGNTWDIHKTSGGYIAYDSPTAKTSGNMNILEIIRDAQSRGYIAANATLTQLDYGVEVCNVGGVSTRFEVNNFSITSQ